jgi:hypothetical protein
VRIKLKRTCTNLLVLNKLAATCAKQAPAELLILRELEVQHFLHYANSDIRPIVPEEVLQFRFVRLVTSITRSGLLPDAFRYFRGRSEKFIRLKH